MKRIVCLRTSSILCYLRYLFRLDSVIIIKIVINKAASAADHAKEIATGGVSAATMGTPNMA